MLSWRELIFDSASACFLRSFSTISGLALATNFSLLSFFITEFKNPLRYSISASIFLISSSTLMLLPSGTAYSVTPTI